MPARRYELTVMVPVTYEVDAVDALHACGAVLRRARDEYPAVELTRDAGGQRFTPFVAGGWAHPPRQKREE